MLYFPREHSASAGTISGRMYSEMANTMIISMHLYKESAEGQFGGKFYKKIEWIYLS